MPLLTLVILLTLPTLLSEQGADLQHVPALQPLVFTHVTLIDCTGAPPKPDMTVVITGDRITAVGKSKDVPVPNGAHVIDAKGKFLIPGLWDMHVHSVPQMEERLSPLYVANGVTGVRIMWGVSEHLEWRKQERAGTWPGPRLSLAGTLVDGSDPIWPGSTVAATAEEGRQIVRATRSEGYDFVKVYSKLSREVYFAIADEAKQQGIPFAGHVPLSISAAEASDAGHGSIEHLTGILLACSTHEEELRKEELDATSETDLRMITRRIMRGNPRLIDTYSDEKAQALFERFVRNETWQVPTLTVLRAYASLHDPRFTGDPRLKYVPSMRVRNWEGRAVEIRQNLGPEDFAAAQRKFRTSIEIVGAMHRAGVPILAGTDVGNPYCFPGFSLHDELELLVQAGLSPMESLQTATINPAKFLGRLSDLGTVEKGKLADLVLLDADPLQDIRHTRRIAAVVLGGQLFDRPALELMLSDAESSSRNIEP